MEDETKKRFKLLKKEFEIDRSEVEEYKKKKKEGSGAFGSVKKVKINENVCAEKVIELASMSLQPNEKCYGKNLYYFVREIHALSKNNCLPLLKLRGYSISEQDDRIKAYIYTDYIENKSLEYHCIKKKDLTAPQLTVIACGMAYGLARLHAMGFIHRDIKPENIMLNKEFEPVIVDFGTAKEFFDENESQEKSHTIVGTTEYKAPELCVYGSRAEYTKLVDVFSYGLVLIAMVKNEHPEIQCDIKSDIENMICTEDIPDNLKTLIYNCCEEDCTDRPSFTEIYNDFKNDKIYFSEDEKSECLKALHKYIKKIENGSQKKEENIFDIIKNIADNKKCDVESTLARIAQKIDKSEMEKLYSRIVDELDEEKTSNGVFYKFLRIIITKRSDFLRILANYNILEKIDTKTEDFCEDVFFLFVFYMKIYPNANHKILERYFENNKDKSRFKFVSFVFSLFLKNADSGSKNYAKFLKFYLQRNVFAVFKNNGLLEEYLQGIALLDKIHKNQKSILQNYFFIDEEFNGTFTEKEIHSLYKFLSFVKDKMHIQHFIPTECLKEHLCSKVQMYDAITFICMTNHKIDLSDKKIIEAVKSTVNEHTPSVFLLQKIVENDEKSCRRVLKDAIAYNFSRIPSGCLFPVIEAAIDNYGCMKIAEFEIIPKTLSRIAEKHYAEYKETIKSYMNMIKKDCNEDDLISVFNALNKYCFWDFFFNSMNKVDINDCRCFLTIANTICKNKKADISPFIQVFYSFDVFNTVKQGLFLNFLKTCMENHEDKRGIIKSTKVIEMLNMEPLISTKRIHDNIMTTFFDN